jgi:glutamate synthase domain-containing protein 1
MPTVDKPLGQPADVLLHNGNVTTKKNINNGDERGA